MVIFFLAVLAWMNIAAEPIQSNRDFGREYGIDLTRKYTGVELNNLFKIVFEEVDVSIDTAFSEGYKSGLLDCEPTNAVLEKKNTELETELKKYKEKALVPWWSIPAGFFVGFVCGEIFEAVR